MGKLIEALRLYAKMGGPDKLTMEQIKLLEESGLFYGTTHRAPRIKKISKYAGDPTLIIEIDREIARDVSIIERSPDSAVVKVRDDGAILEYIDLFWLASLDLYPSEEAKLLRWVSKRYKLNLPERSKLYKTFSGVAIETDSGITYYFYKSGTISVQKPVKVNNIGFTLSAPIDRERFALSIAEDLLKKLYSNVKILQHRKNSIRWYTKEEKRLLKTTETVSITTVLEVAGRRYEAVIHYDVPTGKTKVHIRPASWRYMYKMIHNILASKHGLLTDMIPNTTVLAVEDTALEKVVPPVHQALLLLRRVKYVSAKEPEKIIAEFEKALQERKVPILLADITAYDLVKTYFYGLARENEKLESYLKRSLKPMVEEIVSRQKNTTTSFLPLLENYVASLGSQKCLMELKKMIKKTSVEKEAVVA